MKAIILLIAFMGYPGESHSFQLTIRGTSTNMNPSFHTYPYYQSYHTFDILKYTLHLDWFDILSGKSLFFPAASEILFRADTSLPFLTLDADSNYLKIDSVVLYGKKLKFTSYAQDIKICFDKTFGQGDTGLVSLFYRVVNPGENSNVPQVGFYLYKKGPGVYQTVAYTMSEPTDAHRWMPCHDDPSDKALEEVYVRVPDGYIAASNGELVSDSLGLDSSRTFHWVEHFPVATYLMSITASKFSIVQSYYTNDAGLRIPVQYYIYPPDSTEAASGNGVNIDTVVSMIRFYASLFGDYPFEKYGMAGIEPFQYGGMEHQTITTIRRSYEFNRMVVAHELAHQWWGDLVTLKTWSDIWLNESFATFSELLHLQHLSQKDYETELQHYRDAYFKEDNVMRYALYDPPPKYLFGIAEYYKGAWVLKMLKDIVGDSIFFKILHEYRNQFAYQNATTHDFVTTVNKVTHTNMEWFFDQWIFKQGYPIYSLKTTRLGDSLSLLITQNQTNAPIFKMPIEIGVYSKDSVYYFLFWDSLNVQTFTILLNGNVDSVVIDPQNKLLAKYYEKTTGAMTVLSPNRYFAISNYPNPFNGWTNILYYLPRSTKITLDIYDIIGRKVKSLDEGFHQEGQHLIRFNSSGLSSGVYFCKLTTSFGDLTTKLLVEK